MKFDDQLRTDMLERLAEFERQPQSGEGLVHSAVALPIIEHEGKASFLLTRRAPRLGSHAGQWAFPGGRLDDGETPERAALRELEEEINLHLRPDAILGRLDDYPTRSGYLITPLIVWVGQGATFTPNPAEVASIHFFPLDIFSRPDTVDFLAIEESDRPVIRLRLSEITSIHAPTAAVLWQFAEVALAGRHTRVDHLEQPVFAWR